MRVNARSCRVGFGMSGRLAITMSVPSGNLARLSSGVMACVLVGSREPHCRRAMSGSW